MLQTYYDSQMAANERSDRDLLHYVFIYIAGVIVRSKYVKLLSRNVEKIRRRALRMYSVELGTINQNNMEVTDDVEIY